MTHSNDRIEAYLVNWFSNREIAVALDVNDNFFDAGAIDSFSVIELVEDLEEKFRIRFEQADFQDRRFTTVAGLTNLLAEKMQL